MGATGMSGEQRRQRQAVIDACLAMNALGINQGKSGNVSLRVEAGFLITPTGIAYEQLALDDIVLMAVDGSLAPGQRLPSSEWHFHAGIYAAYPEVGAVVHTHSRHATALACLRQGIPPFHYMVAVAGGDDIPCAPYATFGTDALSRNVVAALENRRACLLANHGVVATGASLERALVLAQEVENLAQQYVLARSLGEPVLLDATEMTVILDKFRTYGQQKPE